MQLPQVVSQEKWAEARAELLEMEKAQLRADDELAARRRRQPMVQFDALHSFDGPDGRDVVARPVRRSPTAHRLPLHAR